MRILNALINKWQSKTPEEKVKMILHGIIMMGGGTIGNTIGDKCAEGRGKIESACVRVTGLVLGGAVAEVAAKASDEYVDQFGTMIRERKKDKEENADA